MLARRALLRGARAAAVVIATAALGGCAGGDRATDAATGDRAPAAAGSGGGSASRAARAPRAVDGYVFTSGERADRGFVVDDALETPAGRTLHFSLHVPESYDGTRPVALYVACPGWEGLYAQGVGANLQEDYPFVANGYIADMIVASPQLDDWGAQSAADVIALTEWLCAAFRVDASRVYLSGCSGGGETVSLVLGMHPERYRRALHTISRWDGDVEVLAAAEVPVYLAIGEQDDYYGAQPARDAYERICSAYRARGMGEERIDELVVLDVKPTSYFVEHGFDADDSQHGAGGYLFAHDEAIMGWFFS